MDRLHLGRVRAVSDLPAILPGGRGKAAVIEGRGRTIEVARQEEFTAMDIARLVVTEEREKNPLANYLGSRPKSHFGS